MKNPQEDRPECDHATPSTGGLDPLGLVYTLLNLEKEKRKASTSLAIHQVQTVDTGDEPATCKSCHMSQLDVCVKFRTSQAYRCLSASSLG